MFDAITAKMPEITLVSDQHNDNVAVCVVSQLLQPSLNVLNTIQCYTNCVVATCCVTTTRIVITYNVTTI